MQFRKLRISMASLNLKIQIFFLKALHNSWQDVDIFASAQHMKSDKKENSIKEFQSNTRLEAFSDGVFAIVITLLVIELTVPELHNKESKSDLFHALYDIRNKLLSYALCFLFVGQLWVAHTNFYKLIIKTNMTLFWINNVLLMCVCLFPFVAAIAGDYPLNPGSVIVFGSLYFFTGMVFGVMSGYCKSKNFFNPDFSQQKLKKGTIVTSTIGMLSLVPLFIADYSPGLGFGIYFVLTLAYIFAQAFFVMEQNEE